MGIIAQNPGQAQKMILYFKGGIQRVFNTVSLGGNKFTQRLNACFRQEGYLKPFLFSHIGHGYRTSAGPSQNGHVSSLGERNHSQGGESTQGLLHGMYGDDTGLAAHGIPYFLGPGNSRGMGPGSPGTALGLPAFPNNDRLLGGNSPG